MNPDENITMTEKIKREISRQYPSVRAFAKECGVAHGTIVSALNNGIEGMAWGKVRTICECLQIDCMNFEPLRQSNSLNEKEQRLLAYYSRLSERGKDKTLEYMQDIM